VNPDEDGHTKTRNRQIIFKKRKKQEATENQRNTKYRIIS